MYYMVGVSASQRFGELQAVRIGVQLPGIRFVIWAFVIRHLPCQGLDETALAVLV